jgi:dolichol-phosphate mannosyltransferase
MGQRAEDSDLGDRQPIVIVYENESQVTGIAYSQVNQALEIAQVDCIVLEGHASLPATTRRQAGIKRNSPKEKSPIEFSVVVPIYDEYDNIPELYQRMTNVMSDVGEPYELIFVDDGSRDKSLELLRNMQMSDPCVFVISLARNFGHQQAISAGLDYASGRAVIVMDGDLQDPPEVIPQFIEKWRENFQVVYAIREKRKENVLKRSLYHWFYHILQGISKIDIPLDAGDFCLVDRCVVDIINSLPERNRFVRGLRSWTGFRQVGIPFDRDFRFAGKSKYSFGKLVNLSLDALISFSSLPLRLATMFGFTVSAFSFLAALYYFIRKQTVGLQPPGFATLTVLLLFLGGVQLITIGIIGEYIGHILFEVKGRPTYIVGQVFESQRLGKT